MDVAEVMKELGISWKDICNLEDTSEAEEIIIYDGESGGGEYGIK